MTLQPAISAEAVTDACTTAVLPGGLKSPSKTTPVLHVINGEHFSGAERVQDLLAQQLPSHGFGMEFVCIKPDRFPAVRISDVPLHNYEMQHRFDLRPAWRIARLVKQRGFQLIHAHTPRSALVAGLASRLAKVPLVYHVHSPTCRDSTRRLRNWVNEINERFSVRRAAALIAVSSSLGRLMRESGYLSDQIAVVPNGVPHAVEKHNDTPPSEPWLLGTVALFRPRKGLEVLIEALSLLRRNGKEVRLRAVGPFETPEYEASIRRLVEVYQLADAIDWTGFTSNVAAELTEMDVFVLPSLFGEGLPMVVLEAMAAGVPVVGSRVEGVPEAIEHGRTGLLAEPGSADDLANQLSGLIGGEHNWQQLQIAALEAHRDRFSDQAMAAGVAAVYRRVLNAK